MVKPSSPSNAVIATSLACLLVGACGVPDPSSTISVPDTLHIGVATTAPTNSPRSQYASYANGVLIAVEHLNVLVNGSGLPFGIRLPTTETQTAVSVATDLRDDPGVVGVVGHSGSGETLEAAPIYGDVGNDGDNALVAITPTSTNPEVTRTNPWIFRVCPTDRDAAEALARYAFEMQRIKQAAIIYRNDLFGRGYQRDFRPVFEALGGEVVQLDPFLTGLTDVRPYARRIARSSADGLVLVGAGSGASEIFQALRAEGVNLTIVGTDDLVGITAEPETMRMVPELRFTSFYIPDRAVSDVARKFKRDYGERFGLTPDHRAALSYDAAMLIGLAAIEVGPDRRRIRDWIASRGRGSPAYEGVTGSIKFNEWGDAVEKQVFIAEVGR